MTSASNHQRDIDTEAIGRGGVIVKIGKSKWTVPTLTIVGAVLGALGTTYRVLAADRDAVLSRLDCVEKACADLRGKQDMDQLMLSEIRTQLLRIDARVAEVQVTLMRGGR